MVTKGRRIKEGYLPRDHPLDVVQVDRRAEVLPSDLGIGSKVIDKHTGKLDKRRKLALSDANSDL